MKFGVAGSNPSLFYCALYHQSIVEHYLYSDYFTSGFDPWDVSQQGLADLLETEAEEQRRPPSKPLTNGVGEHSFSALPNRTASKSHDPWQDEFRALFPDVNVSFGGEIRVYTVYSTIHSQCVYSTI